MTIRRTKSELSVWGALALGGGCLVGWLDLSAGAVQAPALLLMLVSFALTLPGRAPAPLIAILSSVGIPLMHATWAHDFNAGFVIVLIPAFIAAYGGKFAGRLLDTAAAGLTDVAAPATVPLYDRPMSTRFILAVAVVGIAAAGFPAVHAALEAVGHRAPTWVALVWEIMTLLGWIGITPLILRRRGTRTRSRSSPGVTPVDVVTQAAIVAALAVAHAILLIAFSAVLFIPITPSANELGLAALTVYFPVDLLAYLAIVALAAASDAERGRRTTAQREAELRAAALDGRLTALRARLNPHFLFNALNSVHVLARAGKAEDTGRVVEGLTALLRYVLDERRALVPLGEEIEFVRRYLALQQVRFGTRLEYEIKYDETLNDLMVPQLILQPIVENAVEHGVGTSLDGGTVRVSATREGDVLRLVVEDDGPGAPVDAPAGIGLANTRERLATLFGDSASLTMAQATGERGTRVEIAVPVDAPVPAAIA